MAQKSMGWGRALGVDSNVGYTAKEWYAIWGAIAKSGMVVVDGGITSDATLYNRGVFYSVGNRLEVSTPGNARIDVETGAALVEGAFIYNDTVIGAGGDVNVGPASLVVVVRKNYSAVAFVPAVASAALFTVPAYTARVTVIDAASFTQDTNRLTYWDIPLASFDIDGGGVITNWVDERVYADAETKQFFVMPSGCVDQTGGAAIGRLALGLGFGFEDATLSSGYGEFVIPQDYISTMTARAVFRDSVIAPATGDLYLKNQADYGQCAEGYSTHTNTFAFAACALPDAGGTPNVCTAQVALTVPTVGDIVTLSLDRDATDPADTYDARAHFVGWTVSYLGWRA